jgi:ligand-binding sensor domain-containing protein
MPNFRCYRPLVISIALTMLMSGMSSVFALDPKKSIDQYRQRIWLQQNGLPTQTVNVALQTHDGYLWFGTSAGLFLFDGVRFEEINTNPTMEKAHESITTLLAAKDGSIWIGTGYNGLRQYKDGKISLYGSEGGFYNTQIRKIFENKGGKLFIGTTNSAYMYSNGKFIEILHSTYVNAIAEDSLGRIWIGTQKDLKILESADLTKNNDMKSISDLANREITCIYTDHQGNVWIGTGNGLVRWKNDKLKIFTDSDGLSNSHINTIYQDRDGNIWVGTQRGLNRLCGTTWTSFIDSDGLSDNNVLAFLEDREGSLWVCTSNGLNQFININITTYTIKEGLGGDNISSIAEMPDGSLYFLSDKSANITRLKDHKITVTSAIIGPSYVSRDSSLWIGQTGLLMTLKEGRLKRYDVSTGFPSKWITAIGEDNESLVLFLDDIGVRRFVDGHLKPYLLADGREYSSTEYVACFYLDSEGIFWIGTSRGLVKIKDGKSTLFDTHDGISDLWTNSIFDDRHGNLWFSSPRGGITRYKNGKFTAYSTKCGLFTNEINCVLCDDQGNLWLSSPRGIGNIKLQDFDDYDAGRIQYLHTQVYTTEDGMKTDECFSGWQPAGWKTHDGHLWFATKKGAVMINPKTLIRNELVPPVLIEKVMANGKSLPLGRSITLSPGTEEIEFHFTALSFLIPDRILLKYKLEGYDREWVISGTRRLAYYTNLPSGNYCFHVIACNNDGIWNEKGADFVFEISPHFYQTYWFYGLVLIAFGGTIFGVYRLRVWQLLRKEQELNIRIQEATANIKTLGTLLPICTNCKKIRDDKGYWDHLEGYIQEHSEATFSHGICPECAEKLYGKYFLAMQKKIRTDLPPPPAESTKE